MLQLKKKGMNFFSSWWKNEPFAKETTSPKDNHKPKLDRAEKTSKVSTNIINVTINPAAIGIGRP